MSQNKPPPLLESVEQLFFKAPLYAEYAVPQVLLGKLWNAPTDDPPVVDGYCRSCGKQSTFSYKRLRLGYSDDRPHLLNHTGHFELQAGCTRKGHPLQLNILWQRGVIQKTGQHPSLADISSDEVRAYRGVLEPKSLEELHRAIGLASHGVGVGSLVYLRRIFERLIYSRFSEHQQAEGWDQAEFEKLRMGEKITHLKDHLPSFLVEHARIYGILSKGIHELEEGECLALFPVLKDSIIMILDEDKRAREMAAKRRELQAALQSLNNP